MIHNLLYGDKHMNTQDIVFYCGLNEKLWNYHIPHTGKYVCIAPVYGRSTKYTSQVKVPAMVEEVRIDSSAFSDNIKNRLSFSNALDRQIKHAIDFEYVHKVRDIAAYDLLIDEKWHNDIRIKERWTVEEANYAVDETVKAAQFLVTQRSYLNRVFSRNINLVLSLQGVEVNQYMECARRIVPLLEENDTVGLGGWCITGLKRSIILPSFKLIMSELIPFLARYKVKQIHIWGVVFPEALAYLLKLCLIYGIKLSTDSTSPCVYPVRGHWGYGSYYKSISVPPILESCRELDRYGKNTPTCVHGTRCRGLERCRHVEETIDYLAHLRDREPTLVS